MLQGYALHWHFCRRLLEPGKPSQLVIYPGGFYFSLLPDQRSGQHMALLKWIYL